jgi:tetratricopeptide (TPR) repeat protein
MLIFNMEIELLLNKRRQKRRLFMKIRHDDCRQWSARLTKVSTTLLQVACLGVLTGTGVCANAQVLTKEDLRKQIEIYEAASLQAKTPDMPTVQAGTIWSHLGTLYQDAGMYAQSERAFEHAMRLLTVTPVSSPDLARAIDNLGTLYMETGHIKEAEHAESKALKIREESHLESELPKSWYHLATLYLREHRSAKAEEFAERAASAFFADRNATPEDKIGSLLVLGSSLCQTGKYPEAIAKLQGAFQMAKETYGSDQFPTGFSAFILGYAYWKSSNLSSAAELMQRGTEIMGKELGWNHPAYLTVMTQYARFLRDDHRQDMARAIEKQVKSMRAQLNSNPAYDQGLETTDVAALF